MKNWNKRQELKQQGHSQADIYQMLGGRYGHQNLARNNHLIPGPANWCWKTKQGEGDWSGEANHRKH